MSHVDSKDEDTATLIEAENSDDSKESENSNKGKTWTEKDKDGNDVELNDEETPDSEW